MQTISDKELVAGIYKDLLEFNKTETTQLIMKAKIGKNWGKLFNEGHWLARKPMKRRPTSLVVRKTHVNGVDVTVGRERPGHTDWNG